jgi:hypothetical protein
MFCKAKHRTTRWMRQIEVGPSAGRAKISARRCSRYLIAVIRAGFEPRRGDGFAHNVPQHKR